LTAFSPSKVIGLQDIALLVLRSRAYALLTNFVQAIKMAAHRLHKVTPGCNGQLQKHWLLL